MQIDEATTSVEKTKTIVRRYYEEVVNTGTVDGILVASDRAGAMAGTIADLTCGSSVDPT